MISNKSLGYMFIGIAIGYLINGVQGALIGGLIGLGASFVR